MKAVDSKVTNFTSVLKNYMQIVPQFFAIYANLNHILHLIVLLSVEEEFKINLVNQASQLKKQQLKLNSKKRSSMDDNLQQNRSRKVSCE